MTAVIELVRAIRVPPIGARPLAFRIPARETRPMVWRFLMTLMAVAGAGCSQSGNVLLSSDRSDDGNAADHGSDAQTREADGSRMFDTSPDSADLTQRDSAADAGACDCIPGAVETVACGACNSGTQTRECANDCTWSANVCQGEDVGYPVDIVSDDYICPPYSTPAVFFAPHPDDETIGYAATIFDHVAAGRSVFVELMTHGRATGVRTTLGDGGSDPWHPGAHTYTLTPDQIGDARIAEFKQAMASLGVTGIKISDFGDGNLTAAEVGQRVSWWIAHDPGGLSLKGTAGAQDPRIAGGTAHPDHQAVWDALVGSGFGDLRGWLVYHYDSGAGAFSRQNSFTGQPACAAKRTALGSYGLWDPPNNRYAIGYHSVPGLIDRASQSCIEYTIVP